MNTSQKQFNSNFVLDSYLIENNRKSVSRMIDLAIWTTLLILIILFSAMLINAYMNDLIDMNYYFPFSINFLISLGLIIIGMPKLKSDKSSIKSNQPKNLKSSLRNIVKKDPTMHAPSIQMEQKDLKVTEPSRIVKLSEKKLTNNDFNLLNFGHNMQYGGLYGAKPVASQMNLIR